LSADTPVLRPDWPAPPGVQALCTLRAGGVSQPPYDSFNLGVHVQDDPHAVAHNRTRLQQLCAARPVFLTQVHGTDVVQLQSDTPDGTPADACWTDRPDVACTIMMADCLPVLFTDRAGQVVAAAHAGWRGLAAGVLENTLTHVCQAAACSPHEVLVWLGPCIGPSAFEVGHDVLQACTQPLAGADREAVQAFFQPRSLLRRSADQAPNESAAMGAAEGKSAEVKWHADKWHADKWLADKWLADLAGLARWRLAHAGVTTVTGNDSTAAWCTVTQSERFFSYRRDGRTGRFAVCIWRPSLG
jgi:YfiH family protein